MSRAAVLDAILADSRLITLGFNASNVLSNYDGEQRPLDANMFIVLRWEVQDVSMSGDDGRVTRGVRHFSVWVHMLREWSTDYSHIDQVIEILDNILTNMINVSGRDGMTLTLVEPEGRSRDLRDDGYQTLCRQISYKMLSRLSAVV